MYYVCNVSIYITVYLIIKNVRLSKCVNLCPHMFTPPTLFMHIYYTIILYIIYYIYYILYYYIIYYTIILLDFPTFRLSIMWSFHCFLYIHLNTLKMEIKYIEYILCFFIFKNITGCHSINNVHTVLARL